MADPNITEEVHFEMLEKKSDGTFKAKYPKVKSKSGVTFDEHLAEIATQDERGHVMFSEIPNLWQKINERDVPANTSTISITIPDGCSEFRIIGTGFTGYSSAQTLLYFNVEGQHHYKNIRIKNGTISALTSYQSGIPIADTMSISGADTGLSFDIHFYKFLTPDSENQQRTLATIMSNNDDSEVNIIQGIQGYDTNPIQSVILKNTGKFKTGKLEVWGR